MKIVTVVCDKCGKKAKILPDVQINYPNTKVEITYGLNRSAKQIDLCEECQKVIYDFIYSAEDTDEDDKKVTRNKVITPSQFTKMMKEIDDRRDNDYEGRHFDADELMINLLRQLGYGEGIDIFNEKERWYS